MTSVALTGIGELSTQDDDEVGWCCTTPRW